MESADHDELVQLTADIVSAYVTNNTIEAGQLSKLIEEVHLALVRAPAAAAECPLAGRLRPSGWSHPEP